MIKDILQQLAPLDEKIAALRGDPADETEKDRSGTNFHDLTKFFRPGIDNRDGFLYNPLV